MQKFNKYVKIIMLNIKYKELRMKKIIELLQNFGGGAL